MYTLNQIAEITGNTVIGSSNQHVNYFLHDSRELVFADETLFIALKTKLNDGHKYIPELIQKGVKAFLINDIGFDYKKYSATGSSFILSESPLKTIQQLASYHRQQFSIPVIGITGSNGKTVVKEWLYQLLKEDYSICRSPKSYNSQIGVPLSVLNLNQHHTLAIFEAGISMPQEMDTLASIIRPTLGILTALGSAHDEGFATREQKFSEKSKLLQGSDVVIMNNIEPALVQRTKNSNTIFIHELPDADYVLSYQLNNVRLKSPQGELSFELAFSDLASIQNAATCAVVLLQLGLSKNTIAERLKKLHPVALRLELKKGIQNSLLINDFYNSDLDSIKIALNYLQQQHQRSKKVVVVSDIEQSGLSHEALYRQLSDLFKQNKITAVIGIGSEIRKHSSLFDPNAVFFNSTNDFVIGFQSNTLLFSDATILLKGARSFGFEKIAQLLQLKSHDTVFELNLNKLQDNLNYYRSLLAPDIKLMCMVKAMAYGSGSNEIALNLQYLGADYLAVAYADEGVELRQAKVHLPILVMSPEKAALEDIIQHHLEPEIYSFAVFEDFVNQLDLSGVTEAYPIHIKLDTGMHRLGFEEKDLNTLLELLKNCTQVKVKSVFSHLAASDNESMDAFTQQQINSFSESVVRIEKELGYPVIKHICNSGGISRFKNAHFNMVRLGIGMYGIGVNATEQGRLQNVGTLKTKISQLKIVEKGDTVGYNRNGKIEQTTKIAIIPIGYADGFSRLLGNGNYGAFINGVFCKTLGNICMDMCMLDVSHIACEEGDEVILFENAGQIHSLAKALNTIPYEVLTNVSGRVKRVYVKE